MIERRRDQPGIAGNARHQPVAAGHAPGDAEMQGVVDLPRIVADDAGQQPDGAQQPGGAGAPASGRESVRSALFKHGWCRPATDGKKAARELPFSASCGEVPRSGGLLAVFLAEALDAAGGVDDLLLAGVEGVAGGADFDVQRLAAGRGC
jgi:hypothetical protein